MFMDLGVPDEPQRAQRTIQRCYFDNSLAQRCDLCVIPCVLCDQKKSHTKNEMHHNQNEFYIILAPKIIS